MASNNSTVVLVLVACTSIELGVLLALVAFVVHGLVDVPYFKNDLSLQFWALLGIAWTGARHLWVIGHTSRPARAINPA